MRPLNQYPIHVLRYSKIIVFYKDISKLLDFPSEKLHLGFVFSIEKGF